MGSNGPWSTYLGGVARMQLSFLFFFKNPMLSLYAPPFFNKDQWVVSCDMFLFCWKSSKYQYTSRIETMEGALQFIPFNLNLPGHSWLYHILMSLVREKLMYNYILNSSLLLFIFPFFLFLGYKVIKSQVVTLNPIRYNRWLQTSSIPCQRSVSIISPLVIHLYTTKKKYSKLPSQTLALGTCRYMWKVMES